jgi:hypothetical protein
MNNLTLARSIRQIEGNGSDQSLDGITKRGLITQIIVANADSTQQIAKVLLKGQPLYISGVGGNQTDVQEVAVPIDPDDTLKFNAPANVHLTLVLAGLGQ